MSYHHTNVGLEPSNIPSSPQQDSCEALAGDGNGSYDGVAMSRATVDLGDSYGNFRRVRALRVPCMR